MRKWGLVVTALYTLILLGLIIPLAVWIFPGDSSNFFHDVRELYAEWFAWIPIGIVLASQAVLLFLSVDTSQKRLKPRTHLLISVSVAAILTALLLSAAIWSLGFTIRGDRFWEPFFDKQHNILLFWAALWLFWGVVFYFYFRNSSTALTRIVSGLLAGSVLELLIAVPCHVIVRRRHDCSAPAATSFGIATGLAIMLLSFGPSVLFLFKKRFDSYFQRPV